MPTFLLWKRTGEVHAEVLAYDRETHMMRVRVDGGIEYDRVFLPKSKYTREDYQLLTVEDDDAKLPQLRARHQARNQNRQASWRDRRP